MAEHFECAICVDFYSVFPDDYFVSTKRGHIFHAKCIGQYLKLGRRSCPVCRETIHKSSMIRLCSIDPRPTNYIFKIIILGDSTVGKTCVLRRFSDESFNENMTTTVGLDTRRKIIHISGHQVQLNIWDTAGQEFHKAITKQYVRKSQGVIIVYDITTPQTLYDTKRWMEFADTNGAENAIKILVGNKTDMFESRKVSFKDGEVAESLGIHFFETSAKNSYNIEAAFRTMAAKIFENRWLLREAREEAAKCRFPAKLSDEELSRCSCLGSSS